MADDKREPQSYGSQAGWVTGRTGQQVQHPMSAPPEEHADFYENRRDSESSGEDQGGRISESQLAETAEPGGRAAGERASIVGVTAETGGARRDSYFKKRDYE